MLKNISITAVITAAVFGAMALPAYANLNHGDCAYAQKMLDSGATQSGYNQWTATMNACAIQGVK